MNEALIKNKPTKKRIARQFIFSLDIVADADIIKHIESSKNMTDTFRKAMRRDILNGRQ